MSGSPLARLPASELYSVASGDAVFAGGEQIQVTRQRRATASSLTFFAGEGYEKTAFEM